MNFDIFSNLFNCNLQTFDLDVFWFEHPLFNSNKITKEDDFSLDLVDISYSNARTLCSYHLTRKELYFDVIASLLSHLNFIDITSSNLVLSESRYERLRDFSKSTRIGEMAQGINALFVSKRLKFPYIIDFELAKKYTSATINLQTYGKTPDFLIIDNTLKKIGLFESKGNMNGNVTKDLRKAMGQIENVHNPRCKNAKVPVSTKFNNNNDFKNKNLRKVRKSSINYCLIDTICANTFDLFLLIKLNYASWFYLVGDFARVESILSSGVIENIQENNDSAYILDTDTDKDNPIYWVENPFNIRISENSKDPITHFILLLRLRKVDFKIGIYKKVIDELVSSNYEFTLPDNEVDNLKKYPDGTLIYIKFN
jgi:hypothetical protein